MAEVRVYKRTSVPAVWQADAVYFIKSGAETVVYTTDSNGLPVLCTSNAGLQQVTDVSPKTTNIIQIQGIGGYDPLDFTGLTLIYTNGNTAQLWRDGLSFLRAHSNRTVLTSPVTELELGSIRAEFNNRVSGSEATLPDEFVTLSQLPDVSGFVPNTRSITAGNGLTGGGTLAANRTITMGTPGSISAGSTNSVTATSHTHELAAGAVTTAKLADGAVTNAKINDVAWSKVTGAPSFLTSESDPTVPAHVKAITTTEKGNWNTAFGWGNHASAGYEVQSNKATSLASPDNTKYPTTKAVSDAIAAIPSHNPVTLAGQNYLTLSGQQITAGAINLSSHTTGTLPVNKGGSGATTLTGYLKGNGTSAFTAVSTIPYSDISGTPSIPTQLNPTAGTGMSITGAYPNLTFTNTAPNVPSNLALGTANATTRAITNSNGTGITLPSVTTTLAGLMPAADKVKLNGIAAGAQVNVPTNLGSSLSGSTLNITSSTGSNTSVNLASLVPAETDPVWNAEKGNYYASSNQGIPDKGSDYLVHYDREVNNGAVDFDAASAMGGFYKVLANTSSTNGPPVPGFYYLQNLKYDHLRTTQIAWPYRTSTEDIWISTLWDATRQPWRKVWTSGNLANGTTSQYIRGDGSLATFPTIPSGTNIGLGTAQGSITSSTGSGTVLRSLGANYSTLIRNTDAGYADYYDGLRLEFKNVSALPGVTGTSYAGLLSLAPYNDASGRFAFGQFAFSTDGLFYRKNTDWTSTGSGNGNFAQIADRGWSSSNFVGLSPDVSNVASSASDFNNVFNNSISYVGSSSTNKPNDQPGFALNMAIAQGGGTGHGFTVYGSITEEDGLYYRRRLSGVHGANYRVASREWVTSQIVGTNLGTTAINGEVTSSTGSSAVLNSLSGEIVMADANQTEGAGLTVKRFATSASANVPLGVQHAPVLTLQRAGSLVNYQRFQLTMASNVNEAEVFYRTNNTSWLRLASKEWVTSQIPTYSGSNSVTVSGGTISRPALTGDVTAPANSNATTIANNAVTTAKIANNAVTYAKMQDINTQSIIGREAAGSGDPEQIKLGEGLEIASGELRLTSSPGWTDELGYDYEGNADNAAKGLDTRGGYASRTHVFITNTTVPDDVEHCLYVGLYGAGVSLPDPALYENRIIQISNVGAGLIAFNPTYPPIYNVVSGSDVKYLEHTASIGTGGIHPTSIRVQSIYNPLNSTYVWIVIGHSRN